LTAAPRRPATAPEGQVRAWAEEAVAHLSHALEAPLIGWPGWTDVLERHRSVALGHRLKDTEGFREGMATEFEAMLYLSTASMAAPLGHHEAHVYMALFTRFLPEWAKEASIAYDAPLDLVEKELLDRLRRWIYRAQKDHLRSKARAAKAAKAMPAVVEEASVPRMLTTAEAEHYETLPATDPASVAPAQGPA